MIAIIDVGAWEVGAAAIGAVLTLVFKFVLDILRDRREREAAKERLQVLRDIATSNQAIREGQIEQNGKLARIMEVNNTRHDEMIRSINASCKARPIFQQEKQT